MSTQSEYFWEGYQDGQDGVPKQTVEPQHRKDYEEGYRQGQRDRDPADRRRKHLSWDD